MAKDEKLYEPQIPLCFQKHPGQFYEYFNKKIQPHIFVPDSNQLVAFLIVYTHRRSSLNKHHCTYSTACIHIIVWSFKPIVRVIFWCLL